MVSILRKIFCMLLGHAKEFVCSYDGGGFMTVWPENGVKYRVCVCKRCLAVYAEIGGK